MAKKQKRKGRGAVTFQGIPSVTLRPPTGPYFLKVSLLLLLLWRQSLYLTHGPLGDIADL
jgi:hypothetical protein